MVQNNQYGPEAYKRLDLVRKQFKHQSAEQKKQQSVERNQRILSSIAANKKIIVRNAAYAVLALVLLAVIATRISEIFIK
jgi:hypothetical protein